MVRNNLWSNSTRVKKRRKLHISTQKNIVNNLLIHNQSNWLNSQYIYLIKRICNGSEQGNSFYNKRVWIVHFNLRRKRRTRFWHAIRCFMQIPHYTIHNKTMNFHQHQQKVMHLALINIHEVDTRRLAFMVQRFIPQNK